MKRRNFLQALIGSFLAWFGVKQASAAAPWDHKPTLCDLIRKNGWSVDTMTARDLDENFHSVIVRSGQIRWPKDGFVLDDLNAYLARFVQAPPGFKCVSGHYNQRFFENTLDFKYTFNEHPLERNP